MLRVEIQDQEVQAALERLVESGEDMSPAMRDIGEYLVESTKGRFRTGTAPDGTPWAPNSEATIRAALYRMGRKAPPKGATLPAKRPGIGESRRLGQEIHYRAGPQDVEVGSALIYAGTFHLGARKRQYGSDSAGRPIPWGDIPARPFVGLSEEDGGAIEEIVAEFLEGSLEG